jgi:hypothetical protein
MKTTLKTWHVDTLLSNDREIGNYTRVVAWQRLSTTDITLRLCSRTVPCLSY